MSGFVRRSRDQLYHSLTDDVNFSGSRRVDGCVRVSTFSVAVVGPQVLLTKFPLPRNVLWYQDHSFAFCVKAETWKPNHAPGLDSE